MRLEKQMAFIGSEFPTSESGILTVVDILPKDDPKRDFKCLVKCSICHEDEELFPELLKIDKGDLKRGGVPCGCAKNRRWTKEQYEVKVKRRCDEFGYSFVGFCEWKGTNTKLILTCPEGHKWDTTTINSFLSIYIGCPKCAGRYKPHSEIVKQFNKKGAYDGFIFSKNNNKKTKQGKKSYWDYTCPVCSEDEYVKAVVCSGIFTATASDLNRGVKCCRCARGYRWTKEQREYQINKICEDENLKFVGWVGEYKDCKSKFKWLCTNGHKCSSTVNSFINGKCRCKTCFEESGNCNGYYPERTEEKDFLYVMDFLTPYKVGRSFDVGQRRKDLRNKEGISGLPEALQTYTATHQVIYDTEQAIHAELRERGFQYHCDWTNECFTKDCWYILQEILEDYVSSGTIKRVT